MNHVSYPNIILTLIAYVKKLPGVGSKTAERFVFDLLSWEKSHLDQFSTLLSDLKDIVFKCPECGCIADKNGCNFCSKKRDLDSICVVASAKDVYAIEKSGSYRGLYHVIEHLLSPMDGKGVESLKIDKLRQRITVNRVKEVIIALDSSLEGDATSLFLKENLKTIKVNVTRLAFGLPVGSSMEYVDGSTLVKALLGRHNF